MTLTVIGDCHGKWKDHQDIMTNSHCTVQIGDCGFSYNYLNNWDHNYHKFFGGNHDNYDLIYNQPHCLGDWGMRKHGGIEFFFVRGAFSIDREARLMDEQRTGKLSWWENEQLNPRQMQMCLAEYCDTKPAIVITHSLPKGLADKVGKDSVLRYFGFNPKTFNTETQKLLQYMHEAHQPDLWLHGHFHLSHRTKLNGTTFIGLNELETYEIS